MRNVEHTKQRIMEAATQEFSEHGFAGARVDRIAGNAGANKALIYTYFGNKEKLFAAVYREIMGQVVHDVPMNPSDLPGYLARRLDWQFHNPVLSRIVTWGALELDGFPETAGSREMRARKIEMIASAQRDGAIGSAFQPEQVLQLIDALARPWPPRGSVEPERQPEFEAYKQTAVAALRRLLAEETH